MGLKSIQHLRKVNEKDLRILSVQTLIARKSTFQSDPANMLTKEPEDISSRMFFAALFVNQ